MQKKYKTLNDLFHDQAEKNGYIRFVEVKSIEHERQFDEFADEVYKCLGFFQNHGIKIKDEVVINTKSNHKFLIAFWAAILGGMIPIPVAVGVGDEHKRKLLKILNRLKNPTLITDDKVQERLMSFIESNDEHTDLIDSIENSVINIESSQNGQIYTSREEDIAFIQYSSGSTSEPKGITLTHKNLVTNISAIAKGLNLQSSDIGISWMPLTHDMGLIGTHMTLFSYGLSQIIMDTDLFIKKPLMWLQQTSKYRASILTSPNFGYKHLLKIHERRPLKDIDLSSVRLLINGAESISVSLCNEFLEKMKVFGLKKETMFPVYGLAEATLGVSFPETGKVFDFINLDRKSLINEGLCIESKSKNNKFLFMMHGKPIEDCDYRIVDDKGEEVPGNNVGNIVIKGDNVTKSIYQDKELSKNLYDKDGWLETGDCGAICNDQLIITGRKKELIIVNGQNYFPNDIEDVIIRGGSFDLGKIVAVGAINPEDTNDQLVVFVLYRSDLNTFKSIAEEIRRIVIQHLGIEIDYVIPIKKIPKTTSGKIQRTILSNNFIDGIYNDYISTTRRNAKTTDSPSDYLETLIAITNDYSKEFEIKENDNLFEVGISSLTLSEIMMAIDEIYPDKINLDDIFDNPTLKELSKLLQTRNT
ncbi:MAG: non-ribosomal peptide synthetase [Woeseiaceae bacterium]